MPTPIAFVLESIRSRVLLGTLSAAKRNIPSRLASPAICTTFDLIILNDCRRQFTTIVLKNDDFSDFILCNSLNFSQERITPKFDILFQMNY